MKHSHHKVNDSGENTGMHRRGWSRSFPLFLAALVVVCALFLWVNRGTTSHLLDPALLWGKLGKPLIRSLCFISLGLLVGQLIEGLGWTAKLGVLVWPLIRRARLPKEAGTAFTAAFASGIAANTLLYTSWQEGKLDRKQLILAHILNGSLPAYLLHLPTTFFIVYGLLGKAALLYFAITFIAALLRCVATVLASRLMAGTTQEQATEQVVRKKVWKDTLKDTWRKFIVRLRRLLIIITPVYIVVFLLAQGGFFTWLSHHMVGWVSSKVIPVEAMSIIVFSMMSEFTGGFAAAGGLLGSGALSVKMVVIALLVGNVLATPVRALRHQLPHYLGIYSVRMGITLLTISQLTRATSVLLLTAIFVVGF